MSSFKITSISNKNDDGGTIVSGISTFSATTAAVLPSGSTSQRVGIESGSLRYNVGSNTLEFYNGTSWLTISQRSVAVSPIGIFGGSGPSPSTSNVITYINISTTSDSTDFGDLTLDRSGLAACSSVTRGVFGGGSPTSNIIDYVSIQSFGNALDFGDLSQFSGRRELASCSSSTRGVFGGGYSITNTMDYITIATTGNAIDFGDLTVARSRLAGCSSSTRGVFGGGATVITPALTNSNVIDYITIATTGNATDFGDLTVARSGVAACSTSTRGVFGGGANPTSNNTIDYITIATTGNAIDFGDLTVARHFLSSCSSSTRGVFAGGVTTAPATTNTIDYITIATTGNATDFGDLSLFANLQQAAACSNVHGGLS